MNNLSEERTEENKGREYREGRDQMKEEDLGGGGCRMLPYKT